MFLEAWKLLGQPTLSLANYYINMSREIRMKSVGFFNYKIYVGNNLVECRFEVIDAGALQDLVIYSERSGLTPLNANSTGKNARLLYT